MPFEPHEPSTAAAPSPSTPAASGWARYLSDIVFGANDGLITTFAIVSGVAGANLSTRVVLILGMSNLVADGISMGASNYLARRSALDPTERGARVATRHGLVTSAGFVAAGALPLVAYVAPIPAAQRYVVALAITMVALFVIGASRTRVTGGSSLRNGLEMLAVGAAAAATAYLIGDLGARWI